MKSRKFWAVGEGRTPGAPLLDPPLRMCVLCFRHTNNSVFTVTASSSRKAQTREGGAVLARHTCGTRVAGVFVTR